MLVFSYLFDRWQPSTGGASLAILGSELGELSFIDLCTGREVGGTYINQPITALHICSDNAKDTVYLLVSVTSHQTS